MAGNICECIIKYGLGVYTYTCLRRKFDGSLEQCYGGMVMNMGYEYF